MNKQQRIDHINRGRKKLAEIKAQATVPMKVFTTVGKKLHKGVQVWENPKSSWSAKTDIDKMVQAGLLS